MACAAPGAYLALVALTSLADRAHPGFLRFALFLGTLVDYLVFSVLLFPLFPRALRVQASRATIFVL